MPCTPTPSLAEECWPGPNILAICHGAQLLFRFPIHQMDGPDTQSATDTEQLAASRILYTHTILLTSLPVMVTLLSKNRGKGVQIRSWDSSDRVCLNCVWQWSLRADDNLKIKPKKRKSYYTSNKSKDDIFFDPPVIQGPKWSVCKTMSAAYFFIQSIVARKIKLPYRQPM